MLTITAGGRLGGRDFHILSCILGELAVVEKGERVLGPISIEVKEDHNDKRQEDTSDNPNLEIPLR